MTASLTDTKCALQWTTLFLRRFSCKMTTLLLRKFGCRTFVCRRVKNAFFTGNITILTSICAQTLLKSSHNFQLFSVSLSFQAAFSIKKGRSDVVIKKDGKLTRSEEYRVRIPCSLRTGFYPFNTVNCTLRSRGASSSFDVQLRSEYVSARGLEGASFDVQGITTAISTVYTTGNRTCRLILSE